MSIFDVLELLPPDPIFGLTTAFNADPRPEKINLGVGIYKDGHGASYVLPVVRRAEQRLLEQKLLKDYSPIPGPKEYRESVAELVFDSSSPAIFVAQTVGGTGALTVGGELLKKVGSGKIYLPDPTWANHPRIFERAGLEVKTYPYYDLKQHQIDFSAFSRAISEMERGDAILLHGCCHNPTGQDPSLEQWKEVAKRVRERDVIPLFDLAYQGLGRGLAEDVEAIRYFAQEGHEMLVASSFSKNFGLYGERVGALSVVSASEESAERVESQVKRLIRSNYSMGALQGQRIVTMILSDPELRSEWEKELEAMRQRIDRMRLQLVSEFEFMKGHLGMFSLTGLSSEQVDCLREERALYMPQSGRINIAGLNEGNCDVVVSAIQGVMES